jgi:uroporphyrin-III C-methyltransferase/precorrin-2 dehydrogenase/sirohydrochlorin ferrochelatase
VASTYPIFLDLDDRDVLVVGAGEIASRKISDLVAAGARVRVVAPKAHVVVEELAHENKIVIERRVFEEKDVEGAWFVVAATGNPNIESSVFSAAESRRIFVLAVDDLAHASAASGSVIRRHPFIVSISSSAEVPAMTRLLREVLERVLPEDTWIQKARTLRGEWKRSGTPMASRFEELVRAVMKDR